MASTRSLAELVNDESAAEALARHPLFQLSTAGQELFHTNMLYWLALNAPQESRAMWEVLGVDAPTRSNTGTPTGRVTREWKHVDLYIDAGPTRRKLVLENKVLAIATAEQLSAYHETLLTTPAHVRQDPTKKLTTWRLLTLLPLTVEPPTPWEHLTYGALIAPLQETAAALTGDNSQLVKLYANLVEQLVRLCREVDFVDDLSQAVLLRENVTDRLRETRLLALVRKLRTARFANLLTARLQASATRTVVPDRTDGAERDDIRIHVDMSRSEALSDLFFPTGDTGPQFGWQIQERSVKLAMRTGLPTGSTVEARNALALEHLDYFAFDTLPGASDILVAAGKKEWNGYTHEFVYRYLHLRPDATWEQLLELAEALTERARSHSQNFHAAVTPPKP